jgi:DNA-binding NarL/FixJ family response regulator
MRSSQREISILTVCAHTMTCELYSQALNRRSGFHVVGRATSVSEALRIVQTTEVQVALISTSLQDGPSSGIQALQQIRECSPNVKSVMLFEQSEAHMVVTAFRAGAKGVFCSTQDGFKALCRCVERVNSGQVWANSTQLQQVLANFSQRAPLRIVNAEGVQLLTKREEDVVRLVEEGFTNRQIARELRLSEHTVRNNLFRIFDKLGVSTRVELALYAINSSRRALSAGLNGHDTKSEAHQPKHKLPTSIQDSSLSHTRGQTLQTVQEAS